MDANTYYISRYEQEQTFVEVDDMVEGLTDPETGDRLTSADFEGVVR